MSVWDLKSFQQSICSDGLAKPARSPDVAPVLDLREMLLAQLANPVDFPEISRAITPEDQIAIALKKNVARDTEIVAHLIDYLVGMGLTLPQLSVVVESNGDRDRLKLALREQGDTAIPEVVTHDSKDENGNACLLVSPAGNPVHVNRMLFDADVVIPIGSPSSRDSQLGCDSVCPSFCSQAFRNELISLSVSRRAELIRQVNDWLGVFWQIQVVAQAGKQVVDIMVGQRDTIATAAQTLHNQLWTFDLPELCSLSIVTVESGDPMDPWDEIAHALEVADSTLQGNGRIAICCDAVSPPRKSDKQVDVHAPDHITSPAARVQDILQTRSIFMFSQMGRNVTETLGFAFVESPDQLNKLASQHDQVNLIRDAHLCQIRVGTAQR